MTDSRDWLAERQAKLAAADWHTIPRGYYAVAVYEDDDPYRLLGWTLYERKTPRTYKNGRTVGRDAWRQSILLGNGITFEEYDAAIALVGRQFQRATDIVEIGEDLDEHRIQFGKLTGRCGCCGKALTDPDSKMRGIGPECAAVRATGKTAGRSESPQVAPPTNRPLTS
jgi:hypothetical protein